MDSSIDKVGNHTISIYSVSGFSTTIILPDIDVIFDIGSLLPKSNKIKNVFISHGHMDHIGSIGLHMAQRSLLGYRETKYYVPKLIKSDVETLVDSFNKLDTGSSQSESNREILYIDGAVDLGKGYSCTKFDTHHKVDSQGYIIWKKHTKLLPELKEKLDKNLSLGEI